MTAAELDAILRPIASVSPGGNSADGEDAIQRTLIRNERAEMSKQHAVRYFRRVLRGLVADRLVQADDRDRPEALRDALYAKQKKQY